MSEINTQVVLNRLPSGLPDPDDFGMATTPIPEPDEGQFLAQTLYLSVDPYIRSVMSGRHFYGAPEPGSVVRGRTISRIIKSRHPVFKEGNVVNMESGMQAYALSDGEDVFLTNTGPAPLSTGLGILGMPGLTAFTAMTGPAQLDADDTVVVSAASGAVGSMVGQIAKIFGARAIGIAGSGEKCRFVTEQAKFDACINYKTEDVDERLAELCPDGVDIFFDNTGGALQQVVMHKHLALYSRVILCGMMTQYNEDTPPPGPNLGPCVKQRASVIGFVVYDHEHRRLEFEEFALKWFAEGRLAYVEDMYEGLEQAVPAFCALMRGQNFGKTLVHVAD